MLQTLYYQYLILYSLPSISCFLFLVWWIFAVHVLQYCFIRIINQNQINVYRKLGHTPHHSLKWSILSGFLYCCIICIDNFTSQRFLHCCANFAIAFVIVCLYLSSRPFACGWQAVVRQCLMPKVFINLSLTQLRNSVPWSVVITDGSPIMQKSYMYGKERIIIS